MKGGRFEPVHFVCEQTAVLTYEEAERGRAGREGGEELQNTEARISYVQVVVGSALFAAELLQSPPLRSVCCVLHQRSQKSLQTQESGVRSLGAARSLRQLTAGPNSQRLKVLTAEIRMINFRRVNKT